jgi:DNA segregation ATPase FtsK/SpoIIIE, S-DNA-T family
MRGKTTSKTNLQTPPPVPGSLHRSRAREYLAIAVFGAGMFVWVCLLSYDPRDASLNVVTPKAGVSNLGGLVGSYLADALIQVLGMAALLVPLAMTTLAVKLLAFAVIPFRWVAAASALAFLSIVSALLEKYQVGPVLGVAATHAGGAVGTFLHASLFRLFGSVGELIVSFTLMLLSVLHVLRISLKRFVRFVYRR